MYADKVFLNRRAFIFMISIHMYVLIVCIWICVYIYDKFRTTIDMIYLIYGISLPLELVSP